jgi:hypothetical protein
MWQVEYICIARFNPNNEHHPSNAVTEALRTAGVLFVDPGTKKGADDVAIKEMLRCVADVFRSNPSDVCVVLVSNDKDFAPEV